MRQPGTPELTPPSPLYSPGSGDVPLCPITEKVPYILVVKDHGGERLSWVPIGCPGYLAASAFHTRKDTEAWGGGVTICCRGKSRCSEPLEGPLTQVSVHLRVTRGWKDMLVSLPSPGVLLVTETASFFLATLYQKSR